MSLPPGPAAKDKAVYSNTNYILLGMLIEKVTGRPAAQEITTRIIDSARTDGHLFSRLPRDTDPRFSCTGLITRLTAFRSMSPMATCRGPTPQVRWSATGADLNTFFTALLRGELVSNDRLAEMKHTVRSTGARRTATDSD